MIGLSNHLQNAEYLGSSSILRRWLDPYREIGCFENSYISNLNPLFSRKIGGILKKICKIWLVILIPSASTSQHMSTGLWGEPTLHMRNGGVTGQPYNPNNPITERRRMIGVSNDLRNAKYVGSITILRGWLDPSINVLSQDLLCTVTRHHVCIRTSIIMKFIIGKLWWLKVYNTSS